MIVRITATWLLIGAPLASSCALIDSIGGSVCQDAAELCGAQGNEGEIECTGAVEAISRCLVDADSCSVEVITACIDSPALE